ncbi:MAG: hypothetical protein IIW88_01070, partial [Clostridia bacterium]|nr:hypothetical protein [Clostridia bacterium]
YDEKARNIDGKRCKHCDIDLGEEYTVCPLCGESTVNENKKIAGFETAPYPLTYSIPTHEKIKTEKAPFSIEKLKAYFSI